MAFEIPEHFHLQFTTNVELLLQQKMPVMMEGVELKTYSGEAAQVVKQFGEVDFQTKAGRNTDTVFQTIEHHQRWVFPDDYTLALPIDREDELKMLNSPQSPYAEAMRAAWARRWNDTIKDAALGTSQTGPKGATATAFDTANQTIVSGATGLTISKLRQAQEILLSANVDPDAPRFMAITPKQLTDLLESTEVTSSDYNTVKALVAGQLDTFLGFKFVMNTRLDLAVNDRSCIAWAKGGIVAGQWNTLFTRIDERPDMEYLTQVFMAGTIGATRTQEPLVVEVVCDES